MDLRETYLRKWLLTTLAKQEHLLIAGVKGIQAVSSSSANSREDLSFCELSLTPLCGDASLRRYFRWYVGDQSFIAVDTPLDSSNFLGFSTLCHHWKNAHIPVPTLIAEDSEEGFMLLEDLGDETLLSFIASSASNSAEIDQFYRSAIDHLITIQQTVAPENYVLPVYDMPMLQREMGLFDEWFLGRLLNVDLNETEELMLQGAYNVLADNALAQPVAVVHRDYHSRNLMVTAEKKLAIIDFQDAVFGPVSYDLVSLLKDCYVSWSKPQRQDWLAYYLAQSSRNGVMEPANAESFQRWFDLMGAQRHLKAIGIFARLQIRDGKSGYLADIPRTLNYLLELTDYPELTPFLTWLRETVLPAMEGNVYFPKGPVS